VFNRILWSALGLTSLLVIGTAWARQQPLEPVDSSAALPFTTETPGLPVDLVAEAHMASPVELSPEVDPLDQVSQLSAQIRERRAGEVELVQALLVELTTRADAQRAALARTEAALEQANGLLSEIGSESANTSLRSSAADEPVTASEGEPSESPMESKAQVSQPGEDFDAPPTFKPTVPEVTLPEAEALPPVIIDGPTTFGVDSTAQIQALERRINELNRELEAARTSR
jgi:hypothetical protein